MKCGPYHLSYSFNNTFTSWFFFKTFSYFSFTQLALKIVLMIAVGKRIIGPSHCKCWANWNGLSLCEKWNEDGKKLVHGSWISTSVYPLKWNEKQPLNVLTSYIQPHEEYMSIVWKLLTTHNQQITKNIFAWQRKLHISYFSKEKALKVVSNRGS